MSIKFEKEYHWNNDRECFVFWAFDGPRRIRCVVSKEAVERLEPSVTQLSDAFDKHRGEINGIAQRLIESGQIVQDGDIEEVQVFAGARRR